MSDLLDVYPYRKSDERVELLVLKRSSNVVYAGQWRMVGGKVENDEQTPEAAYRELVEETSQEPQLFWTVPSINQFYDHDADTIYQIPVFAAEFPENAKIELNHEHTAYTWISEEEIEEYISWPEQQRLMHVVAHIVTQNEILDEWII